MTIVSPSILAADFTNLGAECKKVVDDGANWLHIDVMDGIFVPNISIGIPVLAALTKKVDCFYDVHLMITRPDLYIDDFYKAGANLICFHAEAQSDINSTIDAIHAKGLKAGLSISPKTSASEILPYLDKLDMALVMSVEPGFGGQSFMPEVLQKVEEIRKYTNSINKSDFLIQVDGGVNVQTGADCVKAGANVLVAGSAVFNAPCPKDVIEGLQAL